MYTWRMPPAVGSARRAEIDSDLWEFQHDAGGTGGAGAAVHVLVRLVRGVPADLRWRTEHVGIGTASLLRNIALTATAVLVVALWAFAALQLSELPPPPVAPMPIVEISVAPPPPPPPPPPCPAGSPDCSR